MAIRILIADDNEVARARAIESLEGRDHWRICGEAGNGQQAVSQAIELKPDIVILDLAMPVMDGLSAAREIGKALPSTPIVLFTLHTVALMHLEAKKAGVSRIVEKFDMDGLLSAVEELTKSRPRPAEEITQTPVTASGPLDVTSPTELRVETPVENSVEGLTGVQPQTSQSSAVGQANADSLTQTEMTLEPGNE